MVHQTVVIKSLTNNPENGLVLPFLHGTGKQSYLVLFTGSSSYVAPGLENGAVVDLHSLILCWEAPPRSRFL